MSNNQQQLTSDPQANEEINRYLKKREKLTNKLVERLRHYIKSKRQRVQSIDRTVEELGKTRGKTVEDIQGLETLMARETGAEVASEDRPS